MNNKSTEGLSRRDFAKASALAAGFAILSGKSGVAQDTVDTLKIGLIGCGGRGGGAVVNCLMGNDNVKFVAMADVFEDKLKARRDDLRNNKHPKVQPKIDIQDDMCFAGLDAYKQLLATDVDIVIHATPPYARPMHMEAIVEAGKHAFIEKPLAVDPTGIRRCIAAAKKAEEKKLVIVTGPQRRYQTSYMETVKQLQDGAVGEILAARAYWNGNLPFCNERLPEYNDLEYRFRNWYNYIWTCGDNIVEQHVHNIDVINWAMGGHPVTAMGMGGRQVRVEPQFGNIYDHFAVEFEYANGARILSMARQIDGCTDRIAERVVGSKGVAVEGLIEGAKPFKYEGPTPNPYEQEHADLIASIRAGRPLNEGRQVAESTMTAILGRMSAYTGRAIKWDWAMNASKLDLTPPTYELGPVPVAPVAMPGKTPLV